MSQLSRKQKKHNNIVLLEKTKLNTIRVLFFKALTDSYIYHDKFLVSNVLREYNEMNEEIKNPEN